MLPDWVLILAYECNHFLPLPECRGRLSRPEVIIIKGINFKDKWGCGFRPAAHDFPSLPSGGDCALTSNLHNGI